MKPTIIGLTGYARVGKDTVANYISTDGYEHMKFASPLKEMMRGLGLTDVEIEGDLKDKPSRKLGGKTPRHAMQTLGTDWGRENFGLDFWVDLAMDKAEKVTTCGGRVVFSDVRFPNEAAAIRERGGLVIRVNRPGFGPVNEHASDNQSIEADVEIVNGGSLLDLCDAVDLALELFTIRSVRAPFAASAFVL